MGGKIPCVTSRKRKVEHADDSRARTLTGKLYLVYERLKNSRVGEQGLPPIVRRGEIAQPLHALHLFSSLNLRDILPDLPARVRGERSHISWRHASRPDLARVLFLCTHRQTQGVRGEANRQRYDYNDFGLASSLNLWQISNPLPFSGVIGSQQRAASRSTDAKQLSHHVGAHSASRGGFSEVWAPATAKVGPLRPPRDARQARLWRQSVDLIWSIHFQPTDPCAAPRAVAAAVLLLSWWLGVKAMLNFTDQPARTSSC